MTTELVVHRAGRVFGTVSDRDQRARRLLTLLEARQRDGFEVWLRDPVTGNRERVHIL